MKPLHDTQPSLTYTATFRHQEGNRTNSLEIRHLSKKEIEQVIMAYSDMYRSIEVICDQTGEVVITQYFSLEFWEYEG